MERLGKYEIRSVLGRGAMGTVYEGWDAIISRRVAIKTVRLPDTDDSEEREMLGRFQQEAQAAGRLQHPNVVGVFDYAETTELAYIVMEFVAGTTLKSVVERGTRPDLAEVGRLMDGLLTGLAYSHSHGVIHRDIKPANVMVTDTGAVKIADFGIARIESSTMTQAGTIMGTPAYMSPEQFQGVSIDSRTDIYSAGIVLFQLLTGKRPFEGSMATIMHAVLNSPSPRPSDIEPGVPRSLDAIVARAIARSPDDRFPDAAAFNKVLQATLLAPDEMPAGMSTGMDQGLGDLLDDDEGTVIQSAGKPLPKTAPKTTPAAPNSAKAPAQAAANKQGTKPSADSAAKSKMPLVLAGLAALLVLGGGGGYFLLGRSDQKATQDARSEPPATVVAANDPPPRVAPQQPGPASGSALLPAKPPTQAVPPQPDRPAAAAPPTIAPTNLATAPQPRPDPPRPVQPQPQPNPQPIAQPPVQAPVQTPVQTPVQAPIQAPVQPPIQPPVQPPVQPYAPPPPIVAAEPARPPQQPVTPPQPIVPAQTVPNPYTPPVIPDPVPRQPDPPANVLAFAPPSQEAVRRAIGAALHGASCTFAVGDDTGPRGPTLRGATGQKAGDPGLHDLVQDAAPNLAFDWQVASVDARFCPMLDLLRPFARPYAGTARAVSVGLADNRTDLVAGDVLLPRVVMPDGPSYLQLDYISSDGSVLHMHSSKPSPPFATDAAASFGDSKPGAQRWAIDEPFGTDLVIAIATSAPLFRPAQALPDTLDAYLRDLRAALAQAQRTNGRVSAYVLPIRTRAK